MCFSVEVPPPVAGHAEFVVHRSRFEAAVVSKCWAVGEQCQARRGLRCCLAGKADSLCAGSSSRAGQAGCLSPTSPAPPLSNQPVPQTYWNDDETPGAGKWWLGTIVSDARNGQDADVLADPWAAGGLWNRFEVAWQGELRGPQPLSDWPLPPARVDQRASASSTCKRCCRCSRPASALLLARPIHIQPSTGRRGGPRRRASG